MLVCRATGRVLSEVLDYEDLPDDLTADTPYGWWPNGNRYAFSTDSTWCDHAHQTPTQDEIAAKVAEAKRYGTVIQHRVNVKR